MKESSGGGALEERGRSASDREKTKLRERQRRSITTKIFNGLRKHGGYTLPPRADINDVLRELAKEAGWVVEPDGTTYRAKGSCHPSPSLQHCAACVAGKSSGATTPTSSLGGGGDGSTTGSPCHVAIQHPSPSSSEAAVGSTVRYFQGTSSSRNLTPDRELSLSLASDDVTAYFMRVAHFGGLGYGGLGGSHASTAVVLPHHHHPFFQEARASNQNTPVGSPQRHA